MEGEDQVIVSLLTSHWSFTLTIASDWSLLQHIAQVIIFSHFSTNSWAHFTRSSLLFLNPPPIERVEWAQHCIKLPDNPIRVSSLENPELISLFRSVYSHLHSASTSSSASPRPISHLTTATTPIYFLTFVNSVTSPLFIYFYSKWRFNPIFLVLIVTEGAC